MKKVYFRIVLDSILFLIPLLIGLLINKENAEDFRPVIFSSLYRYVSSPKHTFNISGKILWINCLLVLGLSSFALYGKSGNVKLALVYLGYIFMGLCFLILFINTSKRMIRKLRPDSFSECSENLQKFEKFHIIKEEAVKTVLSECKGISDGFNQSFFSGHSAGIVYATFSFVFLMKRLFKKKLLVAAYLVLITWAVIVCLSREISGRHHIEDILSGMVVGCALAYYIVTEFFVYADNNKTLQKKLTK